MLGDEDIPHGVNRATCYHGTQCASAVISQTNGPFEDDDPIGYAGIAGGWGDANPENTLLGCKIAYVQNYPVNPDPRGGDPAEDMYELGLEYMTALAERGYIDVLSLSLIVSDEEGNVEEYWDELIERIVNAGVLICCAATNFDEEPVIWSGRQPGVFSVGSSFNDRRWRGEMGWGQSNFGEGLKIVVPTGIRDRYDDSPAALMQVSGVAGAAMGLEYPGYPGPPIEPFGCTSGATPTVGGTALLLLCQERELSLNELTEILCITTDKINAQVGALPEILYDEIEDYGNWDDQVGYGELNAGNAVEYGKRLEVELPAGWFMISSNLMPYFTPDDDPETDIIDGNGFDDEDGICLMFDEIVEDLFMLKVGRF